ncbi:MAG: tocopherol cyclase family protein, partial [Bdellovibrionota bacterium]
QTGQAFFWSYGVINPKDPENLTGHADAFVSFGDFTQKFIVENRFPIKDFSGSSESSAISIGPNYSDGEVMRGSIKNADHEVSWDLRMQCDWSFNAMSWSTGIQHASNIYWYPVQSSARMSGQVKVDGVTYLLDRAPAYQDRNWGRSFPQWWTWIVSNQFESSPGTVLVAGGGRPRVFENGPAIDGLSIGLLHHGREYSFRTNELAKIDMNISFGTWEIDARNSSGERVTISAYAPASEFMDLAFVTPENEVFHDLEALRGAVTVRIFAKKHGKWALQDQIQSSSTGIEFGSH